MGHVHRRTRDVDDVEFSAERIDHDAYVVEVAGQQTLAEGGARDVELPCAQIGHGGHSGDLDLRLRELLDHAQEAVLARFSKRNRSAATSRAAGATDAVEVDLSRRRHVVVHDM